MGRQPRQTRRTTKRRQQSQQIAEPPKRSSTIWQLAAGALILVAVAAVLVYLNTQNSANASTNVNTAAADAAKTAPKIDHLIGCNTMNLGTYHVHAHVTVLNKGKQVLFPLYSGWNYNHDCLYWLHVHDQSGIVHIEAPYKISPTLGTWYDVLHEPLSRSQIGSLKVKPGEQMKVWVATTSGSGKKAKTTFKPYSGDPRAIVLKLHTDVWVEVGPPFKTPTPFNFAQYGV